MRRPAALLRGAAGIAVAKPGAAVTLSFAAAIILFMFAVPRALWPGLLPSQGSHYSTPRYHASFGSPTLIDELYSNFTRVYSAHDDSPPPKPLYSDPWLTPAQEKRYTHLRAVRSGGHKPKFMLSTITRNIASQLPDLLNTIAVVSSFLGPDRISISILEGPSGDTTPHILDDVLRPLLAHLGVPSTAVRIVTNSPKIDFNTRNRIEALAELRNEALKPLWTDFESRNRAASTVGVGVSAVVFFNDVYLHATDMLELLHQHVKAGKDSQGTGITAAWDWMTRDPAYFYDVWVGRTLDTGDLFYPIDGSEWRPSDQLFTTSPSSSRAFTTLQPFQVYSAWNGMAVLNPAPFLPPFNVRFRRGAEGECAASECQLICSDFWKHGWGRVQVVPSVQLAYDGKAARKTADELRDTKRELQWDDGVPSRHLDTTVSWVKDPPSAVRCNAWPEVNGLSANVWEKTTWGPPWMAE